MFGIGSRNKISKDGYVRISSGDGCSDNHCEGLVTHPGGGIIAIGKGGRLSRADRRAAGIQRGERAVLITDPTALITTPTALITTPAGLITQDD